MSNGQPLFPSLPALDSELYVIPLSCSFNKFDARLLRNFLHGAKNGSSLEYAICRRKKAQHVILTNLCVCTWTKMA